MINISDNLQLILNNLKESSDDIQKDIEELKDEKGDQAELILQILKERKQKVDMVYKKLEKHSAVHSNLVMLTNEELNMLCEELEFDKLGEDE